MLSAAQCCSLWGYHTCMWGTSDDCNLAAVQDRRTWGAAPSEALAAVGSAASLQAGMLTECSTA